MSWAAKQRGFSLLELLIAATVFLILLGVIAGGVVTGSAGLNSLVSSSELNEDMQIAGQLITESVAGALYLYPPGAELQLNSRGSFTVRNPRTNDNVWQVGTDPVLAFLDAPEDETKPCSGSSPEGCIYFMAYYPVERSAYLRGSSFGEYLADARNDASWVLMEYRKRLELSSLSPNDTVPLSFSRGQGRMLADLILPGGFNLPSEEMRCALNNRADATPENCLLLMDNYQARARDGLVMAEVTLEAAYTRRSGVIRSPQLGFAVAKRNLR